MWITRKEKSEWEKERINYIQVRKSSLIIRLHDFARDGKSNEALTHTHSHNMDAPKKIRILTSYVSSSQVRADATMLKD